MSDIESLEESQACRAAMERLAEAGWSLEDEDDKARELAQAREAHERALVVGARVRIMPGEGCDNHGGQEAGITGRIVWVNPSPLPDQTHCYLVRFDSPLFAKWNYVESWYYCAHELTLIPDPTSGEIMQETLHRVELLDRESPSDGPAGE